MGRVRDETQRNEAEKLVRTEVRFTAEANEALDEIAKENGISKAQLIWCGIKKVDSLFSRIS